MTRKNISTQWDRDNRNAINDNFKKLFDEFGNVVEVVSEKAYGDVIEAAKLEWKEPVNSYSDLPSEASEGDTRMDRGTGKVYRFNGSEWMEIQQIDAGPVNEVDSRLTSQLAQTQEQKADKSEVQSGLSRKRDKSTLISLSDVDAEFIRAVEEGDGANFTLESIPKDHSVTPQKTVFAKNASKNLFDNQYYPLVLGGSSNDTVADSVEARSAVIEIKPNTTYTVSKSESNRFALGTFETFPEAGMTTDNRISGHNASNHTLTARENDRYLMVYVTNENNVPTQLQIEEGTSATDYEEPFTKFNIPLHKDSIPKIEVDMLDFIKEGDKNLFDGKFHSIYLGGSSNETVVQGQPRYKSAIVEIKPNTTYTVSKGASNRFALGMFESYPEDGMTTENRANAHSSSSLTLTSGENDRFLVVYVSNDSEEPLLQVEEGENATDYEPLYVIDPYKLGVNGAGASNTQKKDIREFYITDFVEGNYVPTLTDSKRYADIRDENGDWDVESLYSLYDSLVDEFPDYITRTLLGNEPVTNLPIYRYDFMPTSPDDEIKMPKMLFTHVHGHEKHITLDVFTFFEDLVYNWKENDALRMMRWNIHFIVVPTINPWGFNNHERKNGNGIDFNRHFDADFIPGNDPDGSNYAGEYALSEIEAQLLDELLNENKDLAFAVDCHNFSSYPSSPYYLALQSSTKNTKKLLNGHNIKMSAYAKSTLSEHFDQSNQVVTDTYETLKNGRLFHAFHKKGIPGALYEMVTNVTGMTFEEVRILSATSLGNLVLDAIKMINDIRE